MTLERWDTQSDGPFSEGALAGKISRRGYDIHRFVYPPGTVFGLHSHAFEKLDAVVAGRLLIQLPEGVFELGPGDLLVVSKDVPHSAQVVGPEPVVSLDATRW